MIRRTLLTGLVLGLGACAAPYLQSPLVPPADFSGPRIQSDGFIVQDGARLPCRYWGPAAGEPRAVVVALHGMNDHANAWRLAGPWWAARGIATYAYDQRGFGAAPGRGTWAGEALMTEDLRTIVTLVRGRHPSARLAVVGESMGGAVAISAFASNRPPQADQLILLAPAVWGWSSQSLANRASLWAAARLLGSRAVEPPGWAVRRIRASDNLAELIANGADPLFIRATRFDALSGLVDLMESASRQLGSVRIPTTLMYGAHDQIIEPGPMRRALIQAGRPPNLRTAFYPDGWHLLNRDLQAEVVFRDIEALLFDAAAILPSGAGAVLQALLEEKTRSAAAT
ncbi:lysophospholipase [Brevundimonas sp. LM2]|uniref:alpha/beta fold hydrolase n=1 Tax=Brevundimonas sp. LM2 TaxID=1938605 RepID=UPI000983A1D4|nr:alpha/beta fold hydrolase [Brevundimonas sp. LM2]AQR61242.1 lysophospholipase [Brevundimonas sp. LM2]